MTRPEIIDWMDRLGRAQPVDPDQVQTRVRAYLHARGQELAQDLGLGHVQDQDLVALGRLDVLGDMPGVPPDVAPILAMLTAEREAQAPPPTGCPGCDIRTHQHWPCTRTMDSAQGHQSNRPDDSDIRDSSGVDQGLPDHAARSGTETPVQNADLDRKRYCERIIKDRADDDWRGF